MALGIDYAKDSVFNQKFDIESELIDIKAYFSEFAEYITPFSACDNVKCKEENGCGAENCKTDEIYRNYMGITQEELNELKERTRYLFVNFKFKVISGKVGEITFCFRVKDRLC